MNVDLTYDDGETISSQFFDDFQIDIDDIDGDTIEKAVISKSSKDIFTILTGASYEQRIKEELKENIELSISNSIILVYNYSYKGRVESSDKVSFITTVRYR